MTALQSFIAALLFAGLSVLTAGTAAANPTTPPHCPTGQVPTWDNSGCMVPGQQFSLSGYAVPTQQSAVAQGTVNSAPAMHDCNGTPVPVSVACSAASPSMATEAISSIVANNNAAIANASAAATTATSQPSIAIVGAGQPGSGTFTPTLSTGTDSTSQLVGLLGDWYSGWMQYIAAAFNFDVGNIQSISSTFLRVPACFQGQASACESAVWQQISQWVPNVSGSSS